MAYSEEAADSLMRHHNQGSLKLDATVAPVHIAYPIDSRLLADIVGNFCEYLRLGWPLGS